MAYKLSLNCVFVTVIVLCCRYVATELPLRYRKLIANKSRCYAVVAGLWTAALITTIAPLLTKPNRIYHRYNVNQKMCGIHWEYPSHYHHQHQHQLYRRYHHHRHRYVKSSKLWQDTDDRTSIVRVKERRRKRERNR